MEWNLNIPKILHIYWGGGVLHNLRFMTIKTFMKYNPDWEVILWYPKYPSINRTWFSTEQKYIIGCKDFIEEAMNLSITKNPIDFEEFGFSNTMSEVHKADFIRLHLLSTLGGVWSDMDIFYIKSMNSLYFNTKENKDVVTFYCDHNYGHSIGFLMSSVNNKFYKELIEIAKREFHPGDYQAIGARIFCKYFNTPESINRMGPAINMDMDVVYPHDATYYAELLNTNTPKFTKNTIGVHWYAGAQIWEKFLETTNGGLINLPNNIIGNLLKNEC